jgi:small subunit ribosomal protein S9
MDEERREPDAETRDEEAERPDEGSAEEPAGREAEDQPEEVQGEETVVEDAAERGSQVPGAELEPIALEPERELSAEERARLEAEAEERARREAEATAEAGAEEPAVRRRAAVDLPAEARVQATGKRKSSIARVVLRAGDGGFEVNDRALDEYFPRPYLRALARQPLLAAGYEGAVDVLVRVHGGGVSGQAGAVRHGVARALCDIDPELRGELKRRGLLTRDARSKERRKAGLKKARKRPQFSKR